MFINLIPLQSIISKEQPGLIVSSITKPRDSSVPNRPKTKSPADKLKFDAQARMEKGVLKLREMIIGDNNNKSAIETSTTSSEQQAQTSSFSVVKLNREVRMTFKISSFIHHYFRLIHCIIVNWPRGVRRMI